MPFSLFSNYVAYNLLGETSVQNGLCPAALFPGVIHMQQRILRNKQEKYASLSKVKDVPALMSYDNEVIQKHNEVNLAGKDNTYV